MTHNDNSGPLTPYREFIGIVENLGLVVREVRRARNESLRDVAAASGVSAVTISRVERGYAPSVENMLALLRWLDAPPRYGTDVD